MYFPTATCKIEDAIIDEKVTIDSEKDEYVQDDEVMIKCDLGYEMGDGSTNVIVRVCLSNQTWSGADPNCTRSK